METHFVHPPPPPMVSMQIRIPTVSMHIFYSVFFLLAVPAELPNCFKFSLGIILDPSSHEPSEF